MRSKEIPFNNANETWAEAQKSGVRSDFWRWCGILQESGYTKGDYSPDYLLKKRQELADRLTSYGLPNSPFEVVVLTPLGQNIETGVNPIKFSPQICLMPTSGNVTLGKLQEFTRTFVNSLNQ